MRQVLGACALFEKYRNPRGEWGRKTVKVRQPVMDVTQPAPAVGTWGLILQRNWEMA